MPKTRSRKTSSSNTIEILDSSSNDSESLSNDQLTITETSEVQEKASTSDDESSESNSSYGIVTRRRLEEQLPVASRTKNAAKGGKPMRFISLDLENGRKIGVSARSADILPKHSRSEKTTESEPKKKRPLKEEIHEAVELEMNDPELTRLLTKIAYCRVFTNYLFRQYDMLSIDFELYSNLEKLMLDLKRRVGAYNAIRRSRMQMLLGEDSNGTKERNNL